MPFFLTIIVMHWISDFVLQTHWQATNKSKNWNALTAHVATYSVSMTLLLLLYAAVSCSVELHLGARLPQDSDGWKLMAFLVITFVTHFVTDAVTSRITSRLWAKGDAHNFFVVVGLDQVIHYTTLYLTLLYLNLI